MEIIAMRTRKSATKSICLVLITLMLFCLLATGCRQTHNEDPKDNDNGPNNGLPTNVPTDSNGNNHTSALPDIDIKTGVVDLYNLTEYSSVVNVEKRSVLGTYRVNVDGGNFECVVLECKVLSDFYDKIQNGTTIYVPIRIVATIESTLQLIDSYDYFVFYIGRLYDYAEMTAMDQETSVLNSVSSYARMGMHEVLPIQNGVVSTDTIYALLDNASISYLPVNEIAGYEEFIANGMDLGTIETHFRYLKTVLESDNSAMDSNQSNDEFYD